MRRFVVLFLLIMVGFVSLVQAQAPATTPKPDPELEKLQLWVGHWTYEIEYKAGPIGPASTATGEQSGQMILGGFILKEEMAEKGPKGELHWLNIVKYDSAEKHFVFSGYGDDGSTASGAYTSSKGNAWVFEGKFVIDGKEYWAKGSDALAQDLMSFTEKIELSTDGKTWFPWSEAKYTKVRAATKK